MLTCEYNMLRVAGGICTAKLYNRLRDNRLTGMENDHTYLTGAESDFWLRVLPLETIRVTGIPIGDRR